MNRHLTWVVASIGVFVLSLLNVSCSGGNSEGKVDMQPGMWEITSRIESSDLPVSIPPSVTRQCLNESDFVPQANASQAGCEIADLTTSGGKVTYTLTCSSGGMTTVSKAAIAYHGTSMEGTITSHMSGGPSAMNMTYTLKGERVGTCN